MIRITKGREPAEWVEIRNTPGVAFEDVTKDELRLSLWKEQGGLCGYCMRRINVTPGLTSETRIEHIKPRKISMAEGRQEETLSYTNMILCCNGDIDGNGHFHCDRSKEDKEICFTPFDNAVIDTLSYSSKDGSIKSSNSSVDYDLRNILNLNHPRLAANRLAVIKGLVNVMGKGIWKKSDLHQKILYYSSRNADGVLKEYCGVIIWYLNKKLKQFG